MVFWKLLDTFGMVSLLALWDKGSAKDGVRGNPRANGAVCAARIALGPEGGSIAFGVPADEFGVEFLDTSCRCAPWGVLSREAVGLRNDEDPLAEGLTKDCLGPLLGPRG